MVVWCVCDDWICVCEREGVLMSGRQYKTYHKMRKLADRSQFIGTPGQPNGEHRPASHSQREQKQHQVLGEQDACLMSVDLPQGIVLILLCCGLHKRKTVGACEDAVEMCGVCVVGKGRAVG